MKNYAKRLTKSEQRNIAGKKYNNEKQKKNKKSEKNIIKGDKILPSKQPVVRKYFHLLIHRESKI